MDLFFEHANNSVGQVETPRQMESALQTPQVEQADALQSSILEQTGPRRQEVVIAERQLPIQPVDVAHISTPELQI